MLPAWLKLSYATFVVLLVPIYTRQYGLGNFLSFSDIALLLGCVAVWLEHPLLASTQAVAVLVPEAFWIFEFTVRLTTGTRLTGLTDYMFDDSIPRGVRALSLFHIWLPGVLVWAIWRLGYDRRAFLIQMALGAIVLVSSYVLTPAKDNVNWVHKMGQPPRTARPRPFDGAVSARVLSAGAHCSQRDDAIGCSQPVVGPDPQREYA